MKARSRHRSLLLAFTFLFGASAGCPHPAKTTTQSPVQAASDPCASTDAMVQGTTPGSCTLAQRICLIAGDLPQSINQPDFLPQQSYARTWQPHLKAWEAQLDQIATEPTLESYARIARKKLELADASEDSRRSEVSGGDLVHALKLVAEHAAPLIPKPGLPCTIPQ